MAIVGTLPRGRNTAARDDPHVVSADVRTAGATIDPPGLHVIRRRVDSIAMPTVVVVHGGMDRASSFGRVARSLPDISLIRYDRRGYGLSRDAGVVPIEGHVADLLAIIGGDRVVLFGHSMGGIIALMAAERRPDLVRSVLSYEAPLPWEPWWPKPRGEVAEPPSAADDAERFMRRMVGEGIWNRLPAKTRADRRAEGEALRADLRSLDQGRPVFNAKAVNCPVISAAGSESSRLYLQAAEELAESLPAGESVVAPGASHGVHLSHPVLTAELVLQACARAALV